MGLNFKNADVVSRSVIDKKYGLAYAFSKEYHDNCECDRGARQSV